MVYVERCGDREELGGEDDTDKEELGGEDDITVVESEDRCL